MVIQLKPEQEQILNRARKAGMNDEEVVEQAFSLLREQLESDAWMAEEREAIEAHIAEGCAQADRGELIDPEDALCVLRERRAKRNVA